MSTQDTNSQQQKTKEADKDVKQHNGLWGRVGMTFYLTDEELEKLQQGDTPWGNPDLFLRFFNEGKIQLDGETYFPDNDKADMQF